MLDIIRIYKMKLLYKFCSSKLLANKINSFYLNKAYKTISKFEKEKKNNLSPKKIKRILLFSDINLKVKDDEFYVQIFDLIAGSKNNIKSRIYLKNYFKHNTFAFVGFNSWLRLRDVFYLKSEMVLGGICKDKAINSVEMNKFALLSNKKAKAKARIEKGLNINNVYNYFMQFSFDHFFDKTTLNYFMSSIYNINFSNNRFKNFKENKKFYEILNNKNVAIVGPAESENLDAAEIDAFDVVVRINYTYEGKNLDKFKKGLKTNISYYNGEQIDDLIANKNSKLPNDIEIACIKENSTKRKEHLQKNNDKVIRAIRNYNSLMFHSSFNILPLAILDILEANVKNVKVFHSDLFITNNRTPNYYPSHIKRTEQMQKKVTVESFLNHDPMTHHRFLKSMYEHNKISGDKKFEQVMKLDTYEYLEKLQDIYNYNV